ncbi:MAG: hypothetical protein L6265_00070 [Thermoplasmatales archaeon]|nr:hypothetical protein [Thermoplasmatales archaeon]
MRELLNNGTLRKIDLWITKCVVVHHNKSFSKMIFGVGDGFSGGVKNEKEDPEHQKCICLRNI